MKQILSLLAILGASGLAGGVLESAGAEPRFSVVFDGQEDPYENVRTPQLLLTKAGTLLAFGQGRSGYHDRSDNDIILKRSTDGGQTWSKFQVIADQGKDALNSEMMEFQYLSPGLQEYHKRAGHDKNPAIKPGYDGRDIARNYVIHSDDDGRTWSALRDITREVKRPAPDISCVPGPGVAIELRAGPRAGRIVVPCFTRWLEKKPTKSSYRNRPYAVFSDDGGQSWQRGELAPGGKITREEHGDETHMVELPGEAILLNTRAYGRNVATSRDGGETWSALTEEPAIKTTPTAAGFIRYSGLGDGAKSRLLFSNPSETGRNRGLISLSYDDGKTWPVQKTLRPGRFKYSSLARLEDGSIGCIFDGTAEKGEFESHKGAAILLARFTLDWLTDGKDRLP
ncbi:MAG: glycoside hydrolase [Verrucomicrobiota bacterium]|nr:glycoside hydrolase [Verrucomicrobiota bacterium]